MSNPFKALILSLCAILIFPGVSNAQNKLSADGSWPKISGLDYTACYPSTWKVDQSGIVGTTFVVTDAQNYGGGFRANATLVTQDLKGSGTDLKTYYELSENKLKGLIANAEVVSSKRIQTPSGGCQELILKGDQGIFHLKWKQRYWVRGNKAYVLTFSASQVTYDDYSLIADKIFNLFALK
jgi:serine/threonine-protein kinase